VKSDVTEHASLVAALEAINERMITAERQDDGAAWRQANRAFHSTMCTAARAPRLEQLIRNLWATFPWDTRTFVPQCAGRAEQEHETILEAVRRRDAERAGALMVEHIEMAAGALRTYVESSGVSLRQLIHAHRTHLPADNA
jgi:DNA-binding GntR family transcriptional regulator